MSISTDGTITRLIVDANGDVVLCQGTTVPTDDTAGFAKGCLFIKTDVAAGTNGVYRNDGTNLLCNFDLTEAAVSAGSIVLADLAAGITPSHVVKFAGEVTWSGGGATLAETIAGVLATDIVIANFQTLGSEGTIVQGAVPTADTITFTLDAANTSNDAVISYMVLRAAA